MKKARTILCIVLALVIVLGSVSIVSAKTVVASIASNRLSNTLGEAVADADFNQIVDSCTATMVLQEKYNDRWRTATGVPTHTVLRSLVKTNSIFLYHKFTLVKGKIYRIKATFKDVTGSTTTSSTYYGPVF